MRRFLPMFAVALATVLVHPPAARAQCNEACVTVISPTGPGWGCVIDNSSGAACYARATKCYIKLCWNAMLTDPSGRTLAVADICSGNVTVRSLVRTSGQGGRKKAPGDARAMVAVSSTGKAAPLSVVDEPGSG